MKYEDVSGRFVQAAGVNVHYGVVGTGEPLICLHGAAPGASGWWNFRHNLDALAARFTTYVVDMPRYGRSEKVPVPPRRLDFLSGVMQSFMDEVGIDRAHYIGNSMGGQTTLKVAIDAPARVNRIVLIGPAPLASSTSVPMPTETIRLIADYYKGEGPTMIKMENILKSLVYDASKLDEELIRGRYEASIQPDVLEAYKGSHWAHQPIDDEIGNIAHDTLILWGQEDRASPIDHALGMLKRIRNARLYMLGRCGHSAQLEYPEEFNHVVVDFLTRPLPNAEA